METTIDATVVDGALQLDEPVSLPDQSRVRVTVAEQPLPHESEVARRLEVLKKFRAWSDAHPIFSDGERLTRDQLHDRR